MESEKHNYRNIESKTGSIPNKPKSIGVFLNKSSVSENAVCMHRYAIVDCLQTPSWDQKTDGATYGVSYFISDFTTINPA